MYLPEPQNFDSIIFVLSDISIISEIMLEEFIFFEHCQFLLSALKTIKQGNETLY
mgnify:CR=1 FL=1